MRRETSRNPLLFFPSPTPGARGGFLLASQEERNTHHPKDSFAIIKDFFSEGRFIASVLSDATIIAPLAALTNPSYSALLVEQLDCWSRTDRSSFEQMEEGTKSTPTNIPEVKFEDLIIPQPRWSERPPNTYKGVRIIIPKVPIGLSEIEEWNFVFREGARSKRLLVPKTFDEALKKKTLMLKEIVLCRTYQLYV